MEEYWEDESPFNQEVESLKEALRVSVKEEIKSEIEDLRKENSELKEKQKNLTKLERDAAEANRLAKYAEENAARNVAKMRYDALLKLVGTPRYWADKTSALKDKCNKCDDQRSVIYRDADGREMKGSCVCSGYVNTYFVAETFVDYVYHGKYSDKGEVVYYAAVGVEDDDYRKVSNKEYNGEDYSTLNPYDKFMFETPEDAQKYVDYLNEKSAK